MATVDLTLVAETKKAQRNVEKFAKSATKSLKSIETAFAGLTAVAVGAVGIFAGRKIISGIDAVTEAASIQEDAINNLNTALQTSGEFSEEASQDFQNYATSIQQASRFGDELILQQLALAKAFGATNEQAKEVVTAATELAAATGKSLEEATRQVAKTLGGFAGELGEVNPAIKALTQEQLRAGEAAKILISQYGGSAQAQIKTFAGATTQLSNTYGDLLEEIGFLITKNPVVIKAIGGISDIISKLIDGISKNRDVITDFVTNLVINIIKLAPAVVGSLKFISRGFEGVIAAINSLVLGFSIFAKTILKLDFVQDFIQNLADGIDIIKLGIIELAQAVLTIGEYIPGIEKASEETKASLQSLQDSISDGIGGNEVKKDVESLSDTFQKIEEDSLAFGFESETFFRGIETGIEFLVDAVGTNGQKLIKELEKTQSGVRKTTEQTQQETKSALSIAAEVGEIVEKGVSISASFFIDKVVPAVTKTADLFFDLFSGAGVGRIAKATESIATAPLQFKQAFENFDEILTGLIDTLPDAITDIINSLPGIIQSVIEKLVELAPEIARGFVALSEVIAEQAPAFAAAILDAATQLVKRLPDVIKNLAEALPDLIAELLKGLPALITAITDALPLIIKALADAIAPLMEAIAENIAPVVIALVEGLTAAAGEIIEALIDSLLVEGGLERIVVALIKAIPRVAAALVQGIVRGLGRAAMAIGEAIARGFKAAVANIGASLADSFSNSIKLPEISIPEPAWLSGITIEAPDWLDDLFDFEFTIKRPGWLDDIGDAISGGGGTIGDILGFQSGGIVPQGFPNDTYPAALTSGEMVVPSNRVGQLFGLIDELASSRQEPTQAAPQSMTVNLQVGEQQLADVILNLNRQGFRLA